MPVGPSYRDGSRSQAARRAPRRTTVPVTGTGRVCGESASSAPSVTTMLDAELVAQLEELGRERPPAHVRLDAADQHHVAAGAAAAGRPRAAWSAR